MDTHFTAGDTANAHAVCNTFTSVFTNSSKEGM
jgi:hypothetical protein